MNVNARLRRSIAALGATGLIIGITGVAASTTANAADTCQSAAWGGNAANQAAMCASAWKKANMSPMSNRGVIDAGLEYCSIKKLRGQTTAVSSIKARYNATRGGAIVSAAESWLC